MSTRWDGDRAVERCAFGRRATWSCAHLSALSWRDERTRVWRFVCPTCGCSTSTTFESHRRPVLRPCVHQGVPPPADQVARLQNRWLREMSAAIVGRPNPTCRAGVPGCQCTVALRVGEEMALVCEYRGVVGSAEELLARLEASDRAEEWVGPDAYSLDASSPAAEQEIAAWREILDSAKARRRP